MSLALPVVLHSDSAAGTPSGDLIRIEPERVTEFVLWVRSDQRFVGFTLGLRAEAGLEIRAFVSASLGDPDANIQFDLRAGDAGRLVLLGGGGIAELGPLLRIGTLTVAGTVPGAGLWLDALPGTDLPAIVTPGFALVDFEVPRLLARVPELGGSAYLALGSLAWVLRRRHALAPSRT